MDSRQAQEKLWGKQSSRDKSRKVRQVACSCRAFLGRVSPGFADKSRDLSVKGLPPSCSGQETSWHCPRLSRVKLLSVLRDRFNSASWSRFCPRSKSTTFSATSDTCRKQSHLFQDLSLCLTGLKATTMKACNYLNGLALRTLPRIWQCLRQAWRCAKFQRESSKQPES